MKNYLTSNRKRILLGSATCSWTHVIIYPTWIGTALGLRELLVIFNWMILAPPPLTLVVSPVTMFIFLWALTNLRTNFVGRSDTERGINQKVLTRVKRVKCFRGKTMTLKKKTWKNIGKFRLCPKNKSCRVIYRCCTPAKKNCCQNLFSSGRMPIHLIFPSRNKSIP